MATNYGKDISCTSELRPGKFATGPRLVGEAAYRRLTTPPGTLIGGDDESDYGLDLPGLLGQSAAGVAALLPSRIRAELLKDERINEVDVTVTAIVEGAATYLEIIIVAQTDAGPFELQIGVDEVTVSLVGLSA